jgi:hypothetical protein
VTFHLLSPVPATSHLSSHPSPTNLLYDPKLLYGVLCPGPPDSDCCWPVGDSDKIAECKGHRLPLAPGLAALCAGPSCCCTS